MSAEPGAAPPASVPPPAPAPSAPAPEWRVKLAFAWGRFREHPARKPAFFGLALVWLVLGIWFYVRNQDQINAAAAADLAAAVRAQFRQSE